MYRNLSILLVSLSLFMVIGCGGGGGDDDGNGTDLATNACSTLNLSTKSGVVLKVINGTACGDLDRSPIVRVLPLNDANQPIGGICTGTVVTRNDVLTAAHCFVQGATRAAVVFGELSDLSRVDSESVALHEGFRVTPGALFNDLAVVQLPITLNIPALPILRSRSPQEGDVVQVYGYGEDENGDLFEELKSGEMEVADVTTNHLRSNYNGDGSNVCFGDSGGPMVYVVGGQPAIVGVVSTGLEGTECLEGDSTLFANLQSSEAEDFLSEFVPDAGSL